MRRRALSSLVALLALLSLSACRGGGGGVEKGGDAPDTTGDAGEGTSEDGDDEGGGEEAAGEGGAPSIAKITFSPEGKDHPTSEEAVTVSAETRDPDGDGVTVDWRWFLNGEEIPGMFSDTLAPGSYKKGDKIEVEGTPRDTRGVAGKAVKKSVTVANLPPLITSQPTVKLDGYKIEATDPDGDELTYSMENGPAGFSVSKEGVVSVAAGKQNAAKGQKMAFVVKDPTGAFSKQEFEVPAEP